MNDCKLSGCVFEKIKSNLWEKHWFRFASIAVLLAAVVQVIGKNETLTAAIIGALVVIHQINEGRIQERTSRENEMRRNVYLPAAEAVIKVGEYLGRASDRNMSEADRVNLLSDFNIAAAKIDLVGAPKSVAAITKFELTFRTIEKSLGDKRRRLLLYQAAYKQLENYIKFLDQSFGSESNPDRRAKLGEVMEERIKELHAKDDQTAALSVDIWQQLLPQFSKLSEDGIEMVICARAELGFDTESEAKEIREILLNKHKELMRRFVFSQNTSPTLDQT